MDFKKWYDQGKFVPQDKDDLIEINLFMSRVQTDRRMNRVGRDIPVKIKREYSISMEISI